MLLSIGCSLGIQAKSKIKLYRGRVATHGWWADWCSSSMRPSPRLGKVVCMASVTFMHTKYPTEVLREIMMVS